MIYTQEDRQKARWLYNSGLSMCEITKIVGAKTSTIRNWLRDSGVPIRSISEAAKLAYEVGRKPKKVKYPDSVRNEAIKLCEDGLPLCDISRNLDNIPVTTILKWLIKAGVHANKVNRPKKPVTRTTQVSCATTIQERDVIRKRARLRGMPLAEYMRVRCAYDDDPLI